MEWILWSHVGKVVMHFDKVMNFLKIQWSLASNKNTNSDSYFFLTITFVLDLLKCNRFKI